MTAPDPRARRAQRRRRAAPAPAPRVDVLSMTRVPAGRSVVVRLRVRNIANGPRTLSITPLGLDEQWMPAPRMLGPFEPGAAVELDLVFAPPVGTLSGRYPFSVAVQAMHPETLAVDPITGVAEGVLSVDEPSHLLLGIDPPQLRGVRGATARLTIRNNGEHPVRVDLSAESGSGIEVEFGAQGIEVEAGGFAATRAHIDVRKPRVVGKRVRHPFAITARADGAGERVAGAIVARPVFSTSVAGIGALVVVLCLWAAVAFFAIGAISDHFRTDTAPDLAITQTQNPADGGTEGAGGTDGGAGGGGDGTGGSGDGNGGGAGSGVPADAAVLPGVRFAGSVTGTGASGVDVAIEPTSLVDEQAEGTQQVNGSRYERIDPGAIGKLSASSLRLNLLEPVAQDMSTITSDDGAWAFPPVSAPGYYLLTFSKPGYQTKRYVVSAVEGSAPDPMKVELTPGAGQLSGIITGPAGAVGSAAITITDGINTLTTSSNSTDAPGTWSVTGLSTPGTYLVSATKDGLGSESGLITLDAAGVATLDLTLRPGVAAITGTVNGYNSQATFGGLGNVTVTASDGDVVRTTSTVTGGDLKGTFVLPQMPTPGSYTVTVGAPGYQSQTQQVSIEAGGAASPLTVTLVSDSATVQGSVLVQLTEGGAAVAQAGAAVTLANTEGVAYKTLTNNDGVFTFNGVAPGAYTVAASRFGNETSYASVEVTTGVQPILAPFSLPYRNETPATSLVVGRVVDARSGGELCNTQLFPDQDCTSYKVTITGNDLPTSAPSPSPSSLPAADDPASFTDTLAPQTGYQLPTADAVARGAGLKPGAYTIVVSADGYEPVSTTVQVPLGATITVPSVALYPTATLTGLVLPAIGEPSSPTCVTATKLDGLGTPVPTCTVSGTGDTATASCSATRSSGETGAPAPTIECALVSSRDATADEQAQGDTRVKNGYRIQNLSAGSYFVQIFVTDPEYVAPQTSTIVVALGEVKNYDTTINRYGRMTVTVLMPDRSTGSLTAAGGAAVAIGNGTAAQDQTKTTPSADTATERKGVVNFSQLAPATYSINVTSPDGTGSQTGIGVAYNTELQITVSITKSSTGFVGKVSISATVMVGATLVTNPGAAGASVTVSGIVGYTNSVPTSASVSVTTDANGCFAVLPSAAAPLPTSSACATVDPSARAVLNLLTDSVSIAVAETGTTQPVPQQNYNIASGAAAITAQPKGTAVTNGFVRVTRGQPTDWPLPNASIQVLSAAPGAAGVTITVDSSGRLTWNDPNFASGQARPGVYKIRASLSGFDDSRVIRVTVPLSGGSVTFVDDATGAAADPTLTPYSTVQIKVVDTSGAAVPNADVTLSGSTIGSIRKSPNSGDNTVSFEGLSTQPTYSATIRVAGYKFTDLTPQAATCVNYLNGSQVGTSYALTSATLKAPATADTASCSIALSPLGSITGILRGQLLADDPTLTDLSGSVVVARKCTEAVAADSVNTATCTVATGAAAESFQVTTDSDGKFRITGTTTAPGLSPGYWQVTATTNGYQTYVQGVPVREQTAPACAGEVDQQTLECVAKVNSLKVLLTFTLTDAANAPINDAIVTLRTLDGVVVGTRDHSAPPAAGEPAWTNSYAFADVDPTTYSLSVTAAGKAPLNVDTITLTLGRTEQTYALVLGSTANGISGGVYGQKPGTQAVPLVAHVTINSSPTDFAAANGTDGQPMEADTAVSNPPNSATDGTYHILNVPNGSWYVHVVSDLYGSQTQQKSVNGGAQELANFVLTAVNHPVAVNLVSTNGFDLSGASATLSTTNDCTVAAADASALTQTLVRPGGAGDTYSASFLSQLPGTYYLRVTQPSGHLAPSQTCQSVVVPSASGSSPPAAVGFEITEYRLIFKIATDPTAGSPANVPIAVTGATIAFSPAIPAGGAAVGTTYGAFVPNDDYEIKATPDQTAYPDWPAATKTISAHISPAPTSAGTAETITVSQLAKVTVTVTRDGAAIAAGDIQASVQLKVSPGGANVGTAKTTTAGVAQFTLLDPTKSYTATATLVDGGTYTVGPSAAVATGVGANAAIPLNLVTLGGAVVEVVAGPVGATVPADASATVQLKADCTPGSAEVRAATAAAANGKVTLTGVRPGTYGMFAVFGGNTNDCTTVTITAGGTATPTVRIINYGTLAVTVRVSATPTNTNPGVTGSVQRLASCDAGAAAIGTPVAAAATGTVTFDNLPAGTYFYVGKVGTRTSPCQSIAVVVRATSSDTVVVPEA